MGTELQRALQTRRVSLLTESYDIKCSRPTKWGNPYRVKGSGLTRVQILARYRQHILTTPHLVKQLHRLSGKRLGCFCKPRQACHVDVLVDLIIQEARTGRPPRRIGFFSKVTKLLNQALAKQLRESVRNSGKPMRARDPKIPSFL